MKKYSADILLKKANFYKNKAEQYEIEKSAFVQALVAAAPIVGAILEFGAIMFLGQTVDHTINAIRDTYNEDLKEQSAILIKILSELLTDHSDEELIKNNNVAITSTINALQNLNIENDKLSALSSEEKTNLNILPILESIENNINIFISNYSAIQSLMYALKKDLTSSYGWGHKGLKVLQFVGLNFGARSDVEKVLIALPEMSTIATQLKMSVKNIKESIIDQTKKKISEIAPDASIQPTTSSVPATPAAASVATTSSKSTISGTTGKIAPAPGEVEMLSGLADMSVKKK